MSQELHYTSVPRGLLPGTRGFCTVACTPNMSGPLRECLESLSGYQQVFPPHDPKVGLNPVVFSHHRLNLGGRSYSVLSRVCFAGLDYTSRSNKYAHHVVLDPAERPAGGPAWLLGQPGFMEPIWQGEPQFITAGRTPPQGDHPAGIAHAWKSLTGDAGWAGTLAESFLADPRRPAFFMFEPGMEVLPLLAEALALLPPEKRWEVEFNTYFTQLPQGLSCVWRGVLRGTAEAKKALKFPNAFILDLSANLAVAEGGALVEWARTGNQPIRFPEQPTEPLDQSASRSRSAGRATAEPGLQPTRETSARTRGVNVPYELIPSLQEKARPRVEGRPKQPSKRSPRLRRWLVILASVATLAVFIISLYYYSFTRTPSQSIIEPATKSLAVQKNKPDIASENKAPEQDKRASAPPIANKEQPQIQEKLKPPGTDQTKRRVPASVTKAAIRKETTPTALVSANPIVEFFNLPPYEPSQLRAQEMAPSKYSLSCDIKSLSFLVVDKEIAIKEVPNQRTWKVITAPTTSMFDDALDVAEFKFSANNLNFEWDKHSMNKIRFPSLSKLLRDSVLEVVTVNGTRYVALKGSPALSTKAIRLLHRGPEPTDYRPRHLTMPWADEEPLRDTQWRLGIQRWRIDVFPREGDRIKLCGGDNKVPTAEVSQDLVPNRINITINIDKHNASIHLNFKGSEISSDKNRWHEIQHEKERLEKHLTELGKPSSDHEGEGKREEIRKQLNGLGKEEIDLKPRIDEYERFKSIVDSELSMTIVMRVGDKLVDVARLGTFATPAP